MNLNLTLKEAESFQNIKEDENTWSKINDVFIKLTDDVKTKEDAVFVLSKIEDLISRTLLSERSKLLGTALNFLKCCILILETDFLYFNTFFQPLMKICGKSNRVFYSRGQDTFVTMCKYITPKTYLKNFVEYSTSANKNVRLAVFKGIEISHEGKNEISGFEELITKGKIDASPDVREVCKRLILKYSSDGNKPSSVFFQPSNAGRPVVASRNVIAESTRNIRQPIRTVVNAKKVIPKIVSETMESKNIKHSPFRKHLKYEENIKECHKIEELEQQIKNITENIDQAVIEPQNAVTTERSTIKSKILEKSFSRLKMAQPKVEESQKQDELTPMRLDKYLSKYRKEYGNVVRIQEATEVSNGFEVKENKIDNLKDDFSTVELKSVGVVNEVINENVDEVVNDNQFNNFDGSFNEEISLVEEDIHLSNEDIEIGNLSKSIANVSLNENLDKSIVVEANQSSVSEISLNSTINNEDKIQDASNATLKYEYTIVNSEPNQESTIPQEVRNFKAESCEVFSSQELNSLRIQDQNPFEVNNEPCGVFSSQELNPFEVNNEPCEVFSSQELNPLRIQDQNPFEVKDDFVTEADDIAAIIPSTEIVTPSDPTSLKAENVITSGNLSAPKTIDFSSLKQNRFSALLFEEESDEETFLPGKLELNKFPLCKDSNISFADKISNKAPSAINLDTSPFSVLITKEKPSSSFLYEPLSLLAAQQNENMKNSGEFIRIERQPSQQLNISEKDSEDFTIIDSFVHGNKNSIRKSTSKN